METIKSYESWIGTDAYDVKDKKIGEISAIYCDDETGRPEWLALRTGLFGLNTNFAPVSGAAVRDGQLHLAYRKNEVRDAPDVKPDGQLTTRDERLLVDHYMFVRDCADRHAA